MMDTTLIDDVKQNNWILPLTGEEYEVSAVKQQGMLIRAGWERTPTFEQMQKDFWASHFGDMRVEYLRSLCKQLELTVPSGPRLKGDLVQYLTNHFQGLMATEGKG